MNDKILFSSHCVNSLSLHRKRLGLRVLLYASCLALLFTEISITFCGKHSLQVRETTNEHNMDTNLATHSALAYAAWLLLQFLSAPHALYLLAPLEDKNEDNNTLLAIVDDLGQPIEDPHAEMRAALQNF